MKKEKQIKIEFENDFLEQAYLLKEELKKQFAINPMCCLIINKNNINYLIFAVSNDIYLKFKQYLIQKLSFFIVKYYKHSIIYKNIKTFCDKSKLSELLKISINYDIKSELLDIKKYIKFKDIFIVNSFYCFCMKDLVYKWIKLSEVLINNMRIINSNDKVLEELKLFMKDKEKK